MINLPRDMSLLKKHLVDVLIARKSTRQFASRPLDLRQVACLLWVCQGRRSFEKPSSRRNVPSAGATYPMTTYLICGDSQVNELERGLYRYDVASHGLEPISDGDLRDELANACFSQRFISEAPASIVVVADYAITTSVYGERGVRYVHMEAGHSGQNIYLACTALGLGTVAVGAFNDEAVSRVLNLPLNHEPLYVFPIGYPR